MSAGKVNTRENDRLGRESEGCKASLVNQNEWSDNKSWEEESAEKERMGRQEG